MAVRPIDGNKLIEWFSPYLHTGEAIPADVVIEDIRSMPTITPPNEPLTCAGCYYLDEQCAPCAYCRRSTGYADYYRCPPEGEEDT